MKITDTHIHLYAEEYGRELKALIAEAQQLGIERFLLPNIDSTSLEGLHQLSNDYPGICYPMMGLHPCYIKENYREELDKVTALLEKGQYIAVGEIGLDKYWDLTFIEEQKEALNYQLRLADKYNLPVSLHTRNATRETIDLIKSLKLSNPKGVFHCFGGTLEEAKEVIDMGYHLGIGGVVTFKNSGLDKIVSELPLSSLVLETDGPYLAPAPHRGKRNDPAMLKLVAIKLAEIYKISLEEIAEQTSSNVNKIFSL